MTNRKEGEAPVNLPDKGVILPIGNNKLIELQEGTQVLQKHSQYAGK